MSEDQIVLLTSADNRDRILDRNYFPRSLTATITLSPRLKTTYNEIIPILSGRGKHASITLVGRRRDDPTKLEEILSQAWQQGEIVEIAWKEDSTAERTD